MRKLLSADLYRMRRSKCLWLSMGAMLGIACLFLVMQYTAMDYTVPLSRVIFLPVSFYGVAAAALVCLFVHGDFTGGFIRNKIIACCSRTSIFLSTLIVCWLACIGIYLVTTLFTGAIGIFLFEINVTPAEFLAHLAMGVGMCLAYGSIYCTIAMLCTNQTSAMVVCMGLSFAMLFVSLQTNQILVQPAYKNGVPNPVYVEGFAKTLYAIVHDLNPTGQAAQLSAMHIFHPLRWIVCDLAWVLAAGIGIPLFRKKDIT